MDIKKVGSLHSRVTPFQYFCQGESHSSKLLLRQGHVNKPMADVCTASREVRIAFGQDLHGYGRDGEILRSFLDNHNLVPIRLDTDSGILNFVSRTSFQIREAFVDR